MEHTPGPWYWDVRPNTKTFRLVTPHGGHMIVMDFARWGMQGAQPRFSDRNGERRGGIMEDGSKIDLSKNPDARLIAAAPELLEACKAMEEQLAFFCRTATSNPNSFSNRVLNEARAVIAKAEEG
jgi:hypothetical protein